MNKRRRIVRLLSINLLIIIAILAAPELGWRMVERVKGWIQLETMRLPPKESSEYRVFTFGGSTVYGVPEPELAFVSQLRYWLKQLYPDRDIKIYNFAKPGSNTAYAMQQAMRRFNDHPDLMIVITGHNEFLGSPHSFRPETWAARVQRIASYHLAIVRMADAIIKRFRLSGDTYALPCAVGSWDIHSAAYESQVAGFESELGEIRDAATAARVKLILGTLPSNLSDWPPVYRLLPQHGRDYQDTIARVQGELASSDYRAADASLMRAQQDYPDDAMLYFLRGKVQMRNGDAVGAHASFMAARDRDPVPTRTASALNAAVRRVADGRRGVFLLDLERIFDDTNPLAGFDLFADNVHGTPEGEAVVARAILKEMSEVDALPAPSPQQQAMCCPVGQFLAASGFGDPNSKLRNKYLVDTAIYSMKTPFFDFPAAEMYLDQARQTNSNSWSVWANLGTVAEFEGDSNAATLDLKRAGELRGRRLDPEDRIDTPYLKEALELASGGPAGCANALRAMQTSGALPEPASAKRPRD